MAKTLVDYDMVMKSLVQDRAAKLTADDRTEAMLSAVAEHSRVKPLLRRRYLFGAGSSIMATPTGWDNEFSSITRIEYPVGEVPVAYLDPEAWLLISSPTATTTYQIQFLGLSLTTGQRVNLEWTLPHTVDDAQGTIPDGHYRAVAMLGASYACLQLAGFYTQAGDPTISIDSQDPKSKARDYMALAKSYRERYYLSFGISPKEMDGTAVAAAGILVDLDRRTSFMGDFFAHPRRYR